MPIRYSWFQKPLIVAILMAGSLAHAQSEPQQQAPAVQQASGTVTPSGPCSNSRGWYCGVSQADRDRALELYQQGNQFFDATLFPAAVTAYRSALKHWKHPSIYYNLMLAYVALDQPVEAYESSVEALRHGDEALEADEYRRTADYQKLLRGRIAELTVSCDEPGAVISLDGKNIFQGPGEAHFFLLPGQHELVASKPGYLTTHHTMMLIPAEPAIVEMRLLPSAEAMLTTQRWPAWRPWAVVGMGVAMGLAGGLLERQASATNEDFRVLFNETCPQGCHESAYSRELKSLQRDYRWYQRLGHGASVASGAAVLGGVVLVLLNRPDQVENPERENLIRVSMTPLLRHDMGGLAFNLAF
jgi:tetratricopeptide (TPR) repeat protein